jgi:uncharacterized protein YndB with AHSA1/START domain
LSGVSRYVFEVSVDAPPDIVFDLWTDLDQMPEWIGGVRKVTDRTGPMDRAGTRYTVWFGSMASPSEVVEVDRPRFIRTRFGNRLLRGENSATFEADGNGTRLTQEFRVVGLIPRIAARLFATGSWKGSFRGELNEFVRLAEREARQRQASG